MIRSSTLSISSSNRNKLVSYERFIDEYCRMFCIVFDDAWILTNVPVFIDNKPYSNQTWLSANVMQSITKHVSALVRGTRMSAKALKKVPSKPIIGNVCPELDQRQVKVSWNKNATSFDGWLTLMCLGKRGTHLKIVLPLKRTKHLNRIIAKGGVQTKGARLSKKGITLCFDVPVRENQESRTLGIDVGITHTISASDGFQPSQSDVHGHTLSSVLKRLSRRKKGSKGFRRAQALRTCFIGWSVNQLNLDDVSDIRLERLKGMKNGLTGDRLRSHWSYAKIFCRLNAKAEEHGVRVSEVNPRNTSRMCSVCGVVDAKNRSGSAFVCVSCGHTENADLNAAKNIERGVVLTHNKPLRKRARKSAPL